MENNFEIDLSRGYLLVKITANNPCFIHFYIEDNCLKSKSIYVKTYESQESYLYHLLLMEVPNDNYLVEWTYNDDKRIRKAIIKHKFSEKIPAFNAVIAKMREEKINQILNDEYLQI